MFPFIMEAIKGKRSRWDVCGGPEDLRLNHNFRVGGCRSTVLLRQQKAGEKDGFADY